MFIIWKIKRILFNSLISILLIIISIMILLSQGIDTVQGIIGWLLLNMATAIISFAKNRKDEKLSDTLELLNTIKELTDKEPLPLTSYPQILDKLIRYGTVDIKKLDYNFRLKTVNIKIISHDIKYFKNQIDKIIDDELFFDLYIKIVKSKLPQSIKEKMIYFFEVVYGDITIKEMAQLMYIIMFSLKSATDIVFSLSSMRQGILLIIPSLPNCITRKYDYLKARRFRDISVLGAVLFCCFMCIFFCSIIFILFKCFL